MSIGTRYWTTRFASWPPAATSVSGYSLLLPVPGDLPVFLELALTVASHQAAEHRVETIVIPDQDTAAVRNIVSSAQDEWRGPLRLEMLPVPERQLVKLLKNPSRNHGVQVITGVSRARGEHIVLHDADLFLLGDDFLDRHYEETVSLGLYASGVSPVWDTWFADRGHRLTATWELCFQRDWARSFPPQMHMGHTAEFMGEEHVFDTTLRPQLFSDPSRIGIGLGDGEVVHFNYVISTYRNFAAAPATFVDTDFRVLLIAIFVALFAREPYDYKTPSLSELATCLSSDEGPVRYERAEAAAVKYQEFRTKMSRFMNLRWLDDQKSEEVLSCLEVFDGHYSYDPSN